MPRWDKKTDVDENGQPILPNEPKVSAKTGKRRASKPTAITQGQINKICEKIKEGNFIKQSVIASGVNYGTYYNAMGKGKKGIRPYCDWYEQVERAKAEAETDKVSILNDEMKNGNVGVIQWWLARMHPQRWERTERIKAEVDNSQKIEIVRFSDRNKDKDKEQE